MDHADTDELVSTVSADHPQASLKTSPPPTTGQTAAHLLGNKAALCVIYLAITAGSSRGSNKAFNKALNKALNKEDGGTAARTAAATSALSAAAATARACKAGAQASKMLPNAQLAFRAWPCECS